MVLFYDVIGVVFGSKIYQRPHGVIWNLVQEPAQEIPFHQIFPEIRENFFEIKNSQRIADLTVFQSGD
jgi:hypothetical protein